MKNLNRHSIALTQKELEEMIGRYFECELSEEEEILLRKELARSTYTSPEIEEAIATMGYLAMGAEKMRRQKRKSTVVTLYRVATAAAAVAMLLTVGLHLAQGHGGRCEAYVNGEKVTDQAEVMAMVRGNLREVNDATENFDENMQNQLSTLGDAIEVEF